ncbi:DUF6146 family protein [Cellulophaga sp. L1A9]|uniref:DUF6146 family protein n=1 Tax=Cellulophaga sp. L1A9 TaxID=2686362 RepID=UPI00131C174A|nr:DUF6146 family protein [Cellulophaga sp. L1A9]
MKKKVVHLSILLTVVALITFSCTSTKTINPVSEKEQEAFHQTQGDTITIADEESDYEIIIIEPGFNFWLQSIAKSEGYYSQNYLEARNAIWVQEWNQRVQQPQRFDPSLYEMTINYDSFTDYGYEVNYKLYNYFIYFQRKYNQRLGSFYPRI